MGNGDEAADPLVQLPTDGQTRSGGGEEQEAARRDGGTPEGRGRLHFRSPFLHQPPLHRGGQIFPRARERRSPGPVVHPRVAVPPQRCSWLSTGKRRGDHDVATGDPEPQPLGRRNGS